MGSKSSVISARVSPELKSDLTAYCKAKNVAVSRVIQDGLTSNTGLLKDLDNVSMDNSTFTMISSLAGGSTLGILAYKGVKNAIESKRPDIEPHKIEVYSSMAGVIVALLVGVGINSLVKALSDND